jgi:hypothetical protein
MPWLPYLLLPMHLYLHLHKQAIRHQWGDRYLLQPAGLLHGY